MSTALQKPENAPVNQFETHVTISLADDETLDRVGSWAASNGMKWTQILLDAGESPLQPMITFWGSGTISDQQQRAGDLIREMKHLGVSAVRVKVEGSINNSGVPVSDRQSGHSNQYFEHHIKLRLAADANVDSLNDIVVPFGARISRNARRRYKDGRVERFVTLRAHDCGKTEAIERLEQLLAAINKAEFDVVEVESEYVHFDSNLELDAGWL